jgi:hypothetical protein
MSQFFPSGSVNAGVFENSHKESATDRASVGIWDEDLAPALDHELMSRPRDRAMEPQGAQMG